MSQDPKSSTENASNLFNIYILDILFAFLCLDILYEYLYLFYYTLFTQGIMHIQTYSNTTFRS
jgi:hypothetical protein